MTGTALEEHSLSMPRALPPAHPELPQPTAMALRLLESYDLRLSGSDLSARTQEIYTGAALLFARWHAEHGQHDLDEPTQDDILRWTTWMKKEAKTRRGTPYSEGYANNLFRALRHFMTWHTERMDLSRHPMDGVEQPKVTETVVPHLEDDEVDGLLARYAKRKDFISRRNFALINVFMMTGARLSELTNLRVSDLNLKIGTCVVTGKGGKQRTVKFDAVTARALDDYLLIRTKHKQAHLPDLWLGDNHRRPLTPNGVRQCLRNTAKALGFGMNPHRFRHNFAHRYLSGGGQEGDLMELLGWNSLQMVRRYTKSAAGERARRNYDTIASNLVKRR